MLSIAALALLVPHVPVSALSIRLSGADAARVKAAEDLAKENPRQEIINRLLKLTRDPSEYVQRAAIQSLGKILGRFVGEVTTADGFVHLIGANGETQKGSVRFFSEPIMRLIQMTRDPDDLTRACAAAALASRPEFIPPSRFEELVPLVWDQRMDTRLDGVEILRHAPLNHKEARKGLTRALWDESSSVSYRAIIALLPRDSKAAIVRLEVLLEKARTDREAQMESFEVVNAIRGMPSISSAVIPVLIKSLNLPADLLVHNRAIALGRLSQKGSAVLPALIKTLGDDGPWRRAGAAWGLAYMGTSAKSAIPDLLKLLSESEPRVRTAALIALGETRTDDETALFAALAKTKDENLEVRFAAVRSLCRLKWDGSAKFCRVLGVAGPEMATVDSYLVSRTLIIPDD